LYGHKKSLKNTPKKEGKLKLKKEAQVSSKSATERLLDERFIAQAVWECLKNNDPEGVIEIIETHLEVVNKAKAAQETNLPRATLYHAMKGKNPTIKTLAKLVNCCG
jgi:DNA-binding phage protein